MKKILIISLLFICNYLYGQNNSSPEEFYAYFAKVFNEEKIDEVQKCFHFPYSTIVNGQISYFDNPNIAAVDYDALKKTGWAYTRVNKVTKVAEGKNTAVLVIDFSRMNKNNQEFIRLENIYTLTKEKGSWQIINLSNIKSINEDK
jgi:type IV secretory pathway component VirB8